MEAAPCGSDYGVESMNWFAQLRPLALGRRAVRSLERIADALDSLNTMMKSDWEAAHTKPKAKPLEIASFDTETANQMWRKEREAEEMELH